MNWFGNKDGMKQGVVVGSAPKTEAPQEQSKKLCHELQLFHNFHQPPTGMGPYVCIECGAAKPGTEGGQG